MPRGQSRSRPSAWLRATPAGPPFAPSTERLRKTPLDEQGGGTMDKVLAVVKDYVHNKVRCRRVGKRPGMRRCPPAVERREPCRRTKLVGNASLLPTIRTDIAETRS